MFDKVEIQEKLRGLVGFKTPLDPDFFALTSDNTESRSGYFYNDNPYAKGTEAFSAWAEAFKQAQHESDQDHDDSYLDHMGE